MTQMNPAAQFLTSDSLDSQLWLKLKEFSVDAPDIQLSFAKRLARENRWSVKYAERVFVEYRKFVFMAVAAGHRVTPSDEVDQAWHLHLAYTESYWTEMCGKLLGQPLHHGPTKGGQQEDDKYFEWYSRTLESYERIFGHKPPADVWPSPEERFDRKLRFARLNTADYWLLKKPGWNFKRLATYVAFTMFCGLTLSACAAVSAGGVALSVVIGLLFAVLVAIFVWLLSKRNQQTGGTSDGGGCSSFLGFGCSNSGNDSSGDSGSDSGGDSGGSSGCSSSGCGGGGCSS